MTDDTLNTLPFDDDVLAQSKLQQYTFTIAEPPPPVIVIYGKDGTEMVRIEPTGNIVYGPNYDPNEAAKTFWRAVAHHCPFVTDTNSTKE